MAGSSSYKGQDLKDMFAAGTSWLEKNVPEINAINVFPVPDGDTGINMFLTMQSSMEEAYRAPDSNASAVIKAMSDGALIGARGNSGVILSQILRGLSRGLEEKDAFIGEDFAQALGQASELAYKSLTQPVEGTMLTVIRDMAEAAKEFTGDDLVLLLEKVVSAAKASVARTPLLLPVLREAGVVDAGGQGLYVLFDGALRYLAGEVEMLQVRKPQLVASSVALTPKVVSLETKDKFFGYCTEFLLRGDNLNLKRIQRRLHKQGESLIVAGDEHTVHIHIHSRNPGAILSHATRLGTLHQLKIQNMDDQHVDFLTMQQERLPLGIAIIAIAPGDGLKDVLESLGATVVPGGQTMNPSVKEILRAVETSPSSQVIILPNNRNIILTAEQAKNLTTKEIAVVPAKTIPQGIAAILSFNPEDGLSQNIQTMTQAIDNVTTVEITKAVRKTQINGIQVRKNQFIGLVDDENLVSAGHELEEVIFEAVDKAGAQKASVVTIYYGAKTSGPQAENIAQELKDRFPELQEVDVIHGGQPHYGYIISIE